MPTFRKPALVIPPAVLEALAEPEPAQEDAAARREGFKAMGWSVTEPAEVDRNVILPGARALVERLDRTPSPVAVVKPDPYAGMTAREAQRVHLAKIATPDKHTKPLPAEQNSTTPYNRTTGVAYAGKNIMRLLTAETENDWETAPGWAGFHQWKAHGRIVSKGEHGTRCLTVIRTEDKTNVRGFVVFHFAQTEQLEEDK